MFKEYLGIYNLHSEISSSPVYIQGVIGQHKSEALKERKFLYQAEVSNGESLLWIVTAHPPEALHDARTSEREVYIWAKSTNSLYPPTDQWYAGRAFGGWNYNLNIKVNPKGGKQYDCGCIGIGVSKGKPYCFKTDDFS